ncbi:hypothetical protein [Stutzerimonas zhaodongensis]|uniref:DUF4365 domain-containing protein n=1 Tax=Stutzerimonas zhaodongensis TaxID=1176257 RepID=A0A365PPA4_9GAMM|nr:hypothetical protein [Stutzerimonas zhaodongensis]QWV17018.1 hypothetical protein KQ248_21655 [Stutzerimonas zhaodongensis]RBA51206.1 hypothetical protein DQ403_22550 [Stutzerimonas zhaodongensis]
MRDLGLLGESVFSAWCADAGLIPNGSSVVDKTGWDFYVEFPFASSSNPLDLHKGPCECKVQVKSTDNRKRSLQIKLSNLRRLATAQMPAFFLFLEFDGGSNAERAYLVHVGDDLIAKTLKRIRELGEGVALNKKTMVIKYGDAELLPKANGHALKERILEYVGGDLAKYVSDKAGFLSSAGFEDGFGEMRFTTEGEQNLQDLIDVSIGAKGSVPVSSLRGVYTRFGIEDDNPFLNVKDGRMEMPDLSPTAVGVIRFKEDVFSVGVSFPARLYVSPFNSCVPQEMARARVESDFFDIRLSPYTGAATYNFFFGEGASAALKQFRDLLILLGLIFGSGRKLICEMEFEGYPLLEFTLACSSGEFAYKKELEALESAMRLASIFDLGSDVQISLQELIKYADVIHNMERVLGLRGAFRVEFGVEGDDFDASLPVACVVIVSVPLGGHVLGAVITVKGDVLESDDGRYTLLSTDVEVEKKLVTPRGRDIQKDALRGVLDSVAEKYSSSFSVVMMDA